MPQQSLLDEYPPMTRLKIEVESYPATPYPDQVCIIVGVATGSGDVKTRWVNYLQGVGRDYLDTLIETITMTFMYGERPVDVARAAQDVHRLSKKHEATYSL